MARKKYDTEALVGQLKAERRTGYIFASVGIVVMFFLVGLYFTADDPPPPEIPKGTAADIAANRGAEPPPGQRAEAAAESAEEGSSEEEQPSEEVDEEPEPEEPAGPATVNIAMSRRGVVWVDGKKIGKIKKKTLELEPGEHTIKAKFGRKTMQQTIEIEGGARYSFSVDRKRRGNLKKIE